MTVADQHLGWPAPPARPYFGRYRANDAVLLGVSAVVADRTRPDVANVVLSGALCAASAATLADMLATLVDDGIAHVTVDLTKLKLCTSHGIDVLLGARRRLEGIGGSLRLVGARGVVSRVLAVARIVTDDGS